MNPLRCAVHKPSLKKVTPVTLHGVSYKGAVSRESKQISRYFVAIRSLVSVRRRVAATSPLRQPTTTGRAALQAQHLRPKGICRGRPVGVELSAWQFERSSCWQW